MEKGRFKKKEKYVSVILVPHFSAKVKSMKFSDPFRKLAVLVGAVVLVVLILGVSLAYVLTENHKLSGNVGKLSTLNAGQQKMLDQQNGKISEFLKREEENSANVKKFMDKYREMTDNYLNGKSNGAISNRSGDMDQRNFIRDIDELKQDLDEMSRTSQSNSLFADEASKAQEKLQAYVDSLPTSWPVKGSITSDFGGRRDPFVWKKSFHEGVDIAADYGTRIRAAGAGKVKFAGRDKVYGRMIVIDHGNGITSMYGHSSKLLVTEGQTVKKGDVIAEVGSSGRSTGAHLHFSIFINNDPVDPLKYLQDK